MFKVTSLKSLILAAAVVCGGCATIHGGIASDADRVAQQFFDALRQGDRRAAYGLFGQGLSETVSFYQFDLLVDSMNNQWGAIVEENTVVLPFHTRPGEENFIPLHTPDDKIQRYTFEVKFEHAVINCGLTLVPISGEYKIVWISFWGSNVYMTDEIREKMEELFSKN